MNSVVTVENLSKRYRIGALRAQYSTLRESLSGAVRAPFQRRAGATENTLWALKGINFQVEQGEVIGVIGNNGAGKSTLLKVLSRITEPTTGRVALRGRVGSLLEVGTGFHPELSGRDNIYLNGAILGMPRAEVRRKFDEIVAFAEVAKFIDTPVKFYSTGMYLRLAFAVAAHLEPEILIVDEVLAVGDVQFQKKCLGKIGDVAREGRTVLFVSHNLAAVLSLCTRALLLHRGEIVANGATETVVSGYLKQASESLAEQVWDDAETAPGNDQVRLHRARLRTDGGAEAGELNIRTPFLLEFVFWNLLAEAKLNLTVQLYNEQGTLVFASASLHEPKWHGRGFPTGLFQSRCHVPGDLLNEGRHRVELLVVRDEGTLVYRHEDILVFDVHDAPEMRGGWHGGWPGVVRPNLCWETELLGQ
ncbi:MAG: ABC transporter ATP-binding protein [Pyrinomonadaceae bacterium]